MDSQAGPRSLLCPPQYAHSNQPSLDIQQLEPDGSLFRIPNYALHCMAVGTIIVTNPEGSVLLRHNVVVSKEERGPV